MANAMMAHEVSDNVLEAGDMFNNANRDRPLVLCPLVLPGVRHGDRQRRLDGRLNESYTILADASGSDGLVPNWVNTSGAGISYGDSKSDPTLATTRAGFPSDRLDWCLNGEPRAQQYLNLIEAFTPRRPPARWPMLVDGYTTTGGMPPSSSGLGVNHAGMAFYGPGGVGAMEATSSTISATRPTPRSRPDGRRRGQRQRDLQLLQRLVGDAVPHGDERQLLGHDLALRARLDPLIEV